MTSAELASTVGDGIWTQLACTAGAVAVSATLDPVAGVAFRVACGILLDPAPAE